MQYDLSNECEREELIHLIKRCGYLFPAGVIAEIRPARRKGDAVQNVREATAGRDGQAPGMRDVPMEAP